MNNITDLVQAAQQAHHEYMAWHEGEQRLLTCISGPRIDEIKQEIQRGRELRRTAIAEGKTAGKEYRQLSAHVSSLESELADMDVVAEELEEGAFERSCSGQDLWGHHLKQRIHLANTYLEAQIASDKNEAMTALSPLLPLLARLVARSQQKAGIYSYLQNESVTYLPDSSLIEPVKVRPLDVVTSLVTELLEPMWCEANPELDPVVMAEIKSIPPSNLIRGDLVGSPAARANNRTKQALRAQAAASPQSAKQARHDIWSPDAMLNRAK
ncbi:hypothetical protein [Aeromonas salmonicida]|uniref:hypothetical protein n=1 Tax=Aeromonas salmonicida TaxID=645 RepID=UPI00259D9CB4|nr:hypothetical protein [Aeromonas salmonicida]MDM5103260.1 hypothetical protein [Aeromonas salmonicida]